MTKKGTPEKTANGVYGAIMTSALNPVNSLHDVNVQTVNNTVCQEITRCLGGRHQTNVCHETTTLTIATR